MIIVAQLLIDTDVLIDCLRDYPDAVTYMEAWSGSMRESDT